MTDDQTMITQGQGASESAAQQPATQHVEGANAAHMDPAKRYGVEPNPYETALGSKAEPSEADNKAEQEETNDAKTVSASFDDLDFGDLPQGMTVNEEFKDQAIAQFKAADLSGEQAQTMVDTYVGMLERMHTDQLQAMADQRTQWVKAVKEDPNIGGRRFEETSAQVRDLFGRYADDDVRTLMNETGLGDHPALVRLFAKIAADLGEDTLISGGSASVRPTTTIEERWYGKG